MQNVYIFHDKCNGEYIRNKRKNATKYSPFFLIIPITLDSKQRADRATTRSLSDFTDSTITALRHLIVALYIYLSMNRSSKATRINLGCYSTTNAYAGAHLHAQGALSVINSFLEMVQGTEMFFFKLHSRLKIPYIGTYIFSPSHYI